MEYTEFFSDFCKVSLVAGKESFGILGTGGSLHGQAITARTNEMNVNQPLSDFTQFDVSKQ